MSLAKIIDLKELARDLLSSGQAEIFIGYQAASLPLVAAPLIIHGAVTGTAAAQAPRERQQQIEQLIFDDRCEMNLTNYLAKFKGHKIAIVVKGCDARSLVGLLQEKQVERQNLIIIGAPCRGVIDQRRAAKAAGCGWPTRVERQGAELLIYDQDIVKRVKRDEVLYATCYECPVHNPVLADYLITKPLPQPQLPELSPELLALQQASPEQRWARFHQEMSKCILCYACRNLCPACYCTTCFADSNKPQWISRGDDPSDAMLFHLQRLMHLGGRCTGCGACVRGCPMGVDLRLYNDHLRSHILKQYGFMAGVDPQAQPPLAMYALNDDNEFIR